MNALLFVSIMTWLTASPAHSEGLLVYYGPQYMAEANAEYRGWTLDPYYERCGLSVMSPSDIGKVVWVKLLNGEWYGPCLSVDVSARKDFYTNVYVKQEVAEVTDRLRDLLRFEHGSSGWGEIYIGQCPPHPKSTPDLYSPPLTVSTDERSYAIKLPKQELPGYCRNFSKRY